jgi:hypothetical protein
MKDLEQDRERDQIEHRRHAAHDQGEAQDLTEVGGK